MPEVISLLSSSPPVNSLRATIPCSRSTPRSTTIASGHISLEQSEWHGDLEFLPEQTAKRRRLSPPTVDTPTATRPILSDNLRLFSDDDVLPVRRNVSSYPNGPFDGPQAGSDQFDSFVFSSSAPEPRQKGKSTAAIVYELSDAAPEGVADDLIASSSQPTPVSRPVFSERTANILAAINRPTSKPDSSSRRPDQLARNRSASHDGGAKRIAKSTTLDVDDIFDSSPPLVAGSKDTQVTAAKARRKVASTAELAAVKASKAAEKEFEKERKRIEKERKAREKQQAADIAEANKSRTNKKNSTPEMIVDMDISFEDTSVGTQVEEYMKQLGVQTTYSKDDAGSSSGTKEELGKTVRWRRKVAAEYDNDLEIWRPLAQSSVSHEKHVLIHLKAIEFAGIAARLPAETSEVSGATIEASFDAHVTSFRKRYKGYTLIYLIEGLTAWLKKNQNAKNRAYTTAVRSQALDSVEEAHPPTQTTQARPRKRKAPIPTPPADLSNITPDHVETILLHLQLHHQPLLIQHTTSTNTTAAQISVLTQHLSTRPYRLAQVDHNLRSASFCMDVGQIRTGDDAKDTYIKMLQEIQRVTPSMAYGIAAAGYGSVGGLVRGFRQHGNLMLEDVRKSTNKDGGWSDRRLGPMVSKRLFKVFMGRDPAAMDGIA